MSIEPTERKRESSAPAPAESFAHSRRIFGTGEMADLTRAFDWSQTSVGSVEQWPDVLLVTVNTLLASRHPMFLWWAKDLVQFYNDAYRQSLGADRHPKALGQRAIDCWPEIWSTIYPQIQAAMTRGEASWHENQLVPIYRNGKLEDVYWTYSYSPVRDPHGHVLGTLVSASETTDRVLAEQRLRGSQEQYESLFELASDAVLVADVNGRITEANLAACQLLSSYRAELLRTSYADLVPEAERPKLWKVRDALLKGGVSVEEWHLIAKNGSPITAEVSATILPDGRWQAFIRDITERKRMEQERSLMIRQLQQERSRLAGLFEQAPAFFAVLRGPEHVFEMINPLYQELIGNRDVIGKPVREAIPEAEVQGFIALLDGVYRTGEPVVGRSTPINLARTAGQPLEQRYMDFIYQPIREADGTISGIIVFGMDVTEGKRAEQALLQTEKLAAVGRLASSIAHEINNPLEAITNLLYLLQNGANEEQRVNYLTQAQAELARVANITTQTLRFHRQSTRPTDTSLREVLESVLTLMRGRITNTQITVEKRYRTDQQITAYAGDLRQVFANLVGNALDASGPGGRMILAVRDAVDWTSGKRGVRVSVADTGYGMSEQTRQHIFDPFFTTKNLTGTGLGLWVSKGILQNHRATVRVRSSQDPKCHGTVFSVFFPLDAAG